MTIAAGCSSSMYVTVVCVFTFRKLITYAKRSERTLQRIEIEMKPLATIFIKSASRRVRQLLAKCNK